MCNFDLINHKRPPNVIYFGGVYMFVQISVTLILYYLSLAPFNSSMVSKFIPYVAYLNIHPNNEINTGVIASIFFLNALIFLAFVNLSLAFWGWKPFIKFVQNWYGFVLFVIGNYLSVELFTYIGFTDDGKFRPTRGIFSLENTYYFRYGIIMPVMNSTFVILSVVSYKNDKYIQKQLMRRSENKIK